jgi:hypothetical protein
MIALQESNLKTLQTWVVKIHINKTIREIT